MLSAVLSYSVVSNSATVWTVACQAPLSMRFSRQEYPSGLPCPPPGDLPNLGTEPRSPTLQADSLPSEPPGKTIITQVVAYLSSRGSSQPRDQTQVSCITGRFFTVWATREAQEYWSGQPIPSSRELPDPGMELGSPALQVDSLPAESPGKPTVTYTAFKLRDKKLRTMKTQKATKNKGC